MAFLYYYIKMIEKEAKYNLRILYILYRIRIIENKSYAIMWEKLVFRVFWDFHRQNL